VETIPCPNHDKGICTIPDRTAVVIDGAVSVHSRDEIERALPGLTLETSNVRRIDKPIDTETFVDTVDQVGGMAVAPASLEEMVAQTTAKVSIVVECSCGHTFIVDTQ
jgi:hypothetical protein